MVRDVEEDAVGHVPAVREVDAGERGHLLDQVEQPLVVDVLALVQGDLPEPAQLVGDVDQRAARQLVALACVGRGLLRLRYSSLTSWLTMSARRPSVRLRKRRRLRRLSLGQCATM